MHQRESSAFQALRAIPCTRTLATGANGSPRPYGVSPFLYRSAPYADRPFTL